MNQITAPDATELVIVPTDNALQVFTEAGAIDPYLDMVRKQIDAFVPDLETAAGRKEVKSFAYKITRSKTALDAAGKKVVDELKALPKKVDETRKFVRDTLDGWADELRKPVDDFEAAEEARIKRHSDTIASMAEAAHLPHGISAAEIESRLVAMAAIAVGPDCEEFAEEYARAKASALAILAPALAVAEKYEADQAELAELRRQAEERAAKDRQEAEAKAAAEREETIRREAAEAARKQAEDAARAEREASERRERDAVQAAAAAEQRARDAEKAAQEAADQAKRDAELAAAEAARQTEAERVRREADTAHKAAINRAAVAALVECGLSEADAKVVITMIARKQIPNVSINY